LSVKVPCFGQAPQFDNAVHSSCYKIDGFTAGIIPSGASCTQAAPCVYFFYQPITADRIIAAFQQARAMHGLHH